MMFDETPAGDVEGLFGASLPTVECGACGRVIARRRHRMQVKASWRQRTEYLCPSCWGQICQWAYRFALRQQQALSM